MSQSSNPIQFEPASPHLTQRFTQRLLHTDAGQNRSGAPSTEELANALLEDAQRERASDIHISPIGDSLRIRFRVDGELLDAAMLPAQQGERLINHFRVMGNLNTTHLFKPEETRLTYQLGQHELDLRIAVAPTLGGETMVLRLLDPFTVQQRLQTLGLSDQQLDTLHQWLATASGMLLVAGPTGSGKTTSVYALMHELKQQRRSVYTVEDPVEYHVPGISQLNVDQDHGLSFASGLRSLLRMDPDYLMMGELRDATAGNAAVEAAMRGRILLSTIHSREAVGAITSLRNWELENHEIAAALTLVVSQRLVPRLCEKCRQQAPLTDDQQRWLRAIGLETPPETLFHATGCEHCRGTGLRGRIGLFEVWMLDEEDYEYVLYGRDERAIARNLARKGHRTLLADGLGKVYEGIISLDGLRATPDIVPRRPISTGELALP